MTKKPSEKNKAWEKDRRDRLNKTFDELAKLLPKFDPSVVWSKIEIIQKAIAFIGDLHKRLEDYLTAKDPELLKEYREFVNCLRFYQERNAQLTELLKKAKVTLPPPPTPVALPQLLVNKPELLPKQENAEVNEMQKPKRQRNRSKKSNNAVAESKPEEVKEKAENSSSEMTSEKVENKPIKPEVVIKPTAIITAFGREVLNPNEAPKAPTPQTQLQPPVPAKPLLLRVRKPRKHHQRLKLIPRPMFRKCYPHPSRMAKWAFDSVSNRKSLLRHRRNEAKKRKQQRRKEKSSKRLKVAFNPEIVQPEQLREQSVSPTAAFLLSFPVVTSSMLGGKNVENTDSSVNLENLNNFFTTEEYSKFCDQNSVVGEKIISPPLPVEDKPLVNEKPMTVFTVSAITRPSAPKKTLAGNGIRTNGGMPIPATTTSFDSCFNFNNGNPMIGSTSMCAATNNQQITSKQYSQPNLPFPIVTAYPSAIAPSNKLPIKQEQTTLVTNSSEKFFPRYNHSTPNSIRSSLESPSKLLNPSQSNVTPPQKDLTGSSRSNLPLTTNWSVKQSETPRGKSITNPVSYSNGSGSKPSSSLSIAASTSHSGTLNSKVSPASKSTNKMPFLSPTKNFFYDFPTQNRTTSSSVSVPGSGTADPLISATAPLKTNNSVKSEFPWTPPNTSIPNTSCNQNALFTPFDLATIVCDSLTSTNCTFSLTTAKSTEPSVVDAGNKAPANTRCNQMNLFLPYEEAQYTPTYNPLTQTKSSTESQMPRESTSWKSLEKPKDAAAADQIFYDCEQSKPQQKSHVNWMTSPTTTDYTTAAAPASALPLPPMDFGNQFTGSSTNFDLSFSCRKDSYDDDNQFINWSPTKPLNADFSAAYNFENFGSNEAPPNKTVKQIFSVSQLVDQTPSQQEMASSLKKAMPKAPAEKSTSAKQSFSNIYSAESLIAKKDNRFYNPAESLPNTQTDYHNSNSYFFNYPTTQNCSENDYLGAGSYSTAASQQPVKASSMHSTVSVAPGAVGVGVGAGPGANPTFDSSSAATTSNNFFSHTISSNNNDPYDPTYFPSSNYNQSWNHGSVTSHGVASKGGTAGSLNIFNQQGQFGTLPLPLQETASCQQQQQQQQQNSNVSGNLTNFNLSSICPEIDGKGGPNVW
ncbi:mucin-4-like [Eupeodes corollae]|uniref:mucin-4-like n=1 Tax=Eupeodes corollae TaxID=290404 RepID=UPI00248FDD20|nr:mucin-4-like [Eupeodes corollae]